MSVIADLPDIRPSLLLDFANSGRVHPLIQCTRASTATCYGPDRRLRNVAANVPRIDYDPATGKCLGLLVEEARTNYILNSGDLSQSAWLKSRATAAAPDADGFCKVVEDGSNNSHYVSQAVSLSASDRVVRLLVKAGERTKAQIEFTGNTGNAGRRVVVDLVAGTVLSNSLIGSGGLTSSSVSARLIGAGVTELTIQVTPTATTGATANLLIILHDGTGVSYQGDGVSGIYVKEVQLEAATFPTSFIPTTTAAATRAADLVSIDYTLPTVGAIVSSLVGVSSANTSNAYVWSAINPADQSADHAYFYYPGASQSTNWWVNKGGVGQSGGNVLGRRQSAGFCFDASTKTAAIASGSLLFEDTTRPRDFPSNLSQLLLGRSRANAYFLNGCISRLAVYSGRITNAQLQRLTA